MASNLVWKLTGGAANASLSASLGGTVSSVAVSGSPMNNLFPNVTASQATAGLTDYRAFDLVNTGDAAAVGTLLWFDAETSSTDTTLQFGLDALDSSLSIADGLTAPVGISFSEPNAGAPLNVGDIPAGHGFRVWFKRIVTAGAANTSSDLATFTWEYA